MKYTSAQANKLLKKLNDEYSALLDSLKSQSTLTVSTLWTYHINKISPLQ